jgi:hypothetical protein
VTGLAVDPRLDKESTALQANIFTPTKRYADEFTDEQLLEFVEQNDGAVPLPLVIVNPDEWSSDSPQIIENEDNWNLLTSIATDDSKKALAVRERLGLGYAGVVAELLLMCGPSELEERVFDVMPVPFERLRPSVIESSKRSDFD